MTFADKLRKLMGDREQGEVARSIGVAPSALSNYLNRNSTPSVEIALKLAREFKCSLEWMIDDSREWENKGVLTDFDLMGDACKRLVAHARKVEKQAEELRKLPWSDLGPELLGIPVDDPLPVKFDAIIEALMQLQKALDYLDQFDASQMLPRHVQNPPKIGDLKDAIKDLKSEPDIARSLKYIELRELARALQRHGAKSADHDLEGHRRRLLRMVEPKTPKHSRAKNG